LPIWEQDVKFGIYVSPTPDAGLFGDLAAAIEEAGFDSVFIPEHTHVPVDVEQLRPAGSLAHDTFAGADPFVHLTVAATKTERLLLGTGAALLTERDPIILAKIASSVDQLSRGRLILGLGAGWNHAELRNHGIDPEARWSVWEEKLAALRAIWTQDVAEFAGTHVSFGPLRQLPKPYRDPYPPLLMSANGPSAIRKAVAAGMQGWQPVLLPGVEPFAMGERISFLRELEGEGDGMEVTVLDFTGVAGPDAIAVREREGVDRLVFRIAAAPVAEFSSDLAAHATAASSFR